MKTRQACTLFLSPRMELGHWNFCCFSAPPCSWPSQAVTCPVWVIPVQWDLQQADETPLIQGAVSRFTLLLVLNHFLHFAPSLPLCPYHHLFRNQVGRNGFMSCTYLQDPKCGTLRSRVTKDLDYLNREKK